MPLYEYQCDACGKRFEQIQKFADPPVDVCALCGAGGVRKLMSSPAIQFKGTGWYITDYARKGQTDPLAGNSAPKTGDDTKGKGDDSSTGDKSTTSDAGGKSASDKKTGSSSSSGQDTKKASTEKSSAAAPASSTPKTPAASSKPAS